LSVLAILAALTVPDIADAHFNGRYHRHTYGVVVRRPVLTVLGVPVVVVRRAPVYRTVRYYRRRY
jgi:hypothetical protein